MKTLTPRRRYFFSNLLIGWLLLSPAGVVCAASQQTDATLAAKSTVGSTGGNVLLLAGETYKQVGSDVIAVQGDIDIAAKTVDILEARQTSRTVTETRSKQSGLTLAVSSPVISAIQTVQQMSQAAADTQDPRMKLLAAASAGLSANNAVDALKAGQGTTVEIKNPDGSTTLKDHQIPVLDESGKTIGSRDPNAADQMGGINVSLSIGSSKSRSKSTQTSNTAVASNLTAGRDISITASDAGEQSDLTIQGSKATAARNLTLTADDEIKLLAARNTAEQHSTNKNRSASVGIGFALGGTQNGFTIQAGVSGGKGQANGTDLAWSNTHVEAGNLLAFESGGNTTLRGAVARGEQVIANVGKDLTIESLQDLSTYDSKQKSLGASVSLCILPFCVGATPVSGSVSASASKVNSDYASVTEQSALRAGGGGFDVKVKNDTDLKGGAITSTQQAIDDNKNAFHTDGTLTLSDIDNKASYSAKSASINIGTGFSAAGALVPQGTSMGFGKDSGSASSTTRAAISGIAGNTNARTGDKETGVAKIFDAAKVQKEIEAQTKITQMFGQLASKAVGDFATNKLKEAGTLRDQAEQEPDDARARQLRAQADEIDSQWGKQGTLRLAAHTVIGGLTGGGSGAAGAAAGTITAPLVADALRNAGIDGNLATTLTALASTTVGAAVGGTAGAGAALNEVANNFLTHAESSRRLRLQVEKTACRDDACRTEKQQEIDRLNQLDAWRDQQIEQACRVPSSAGCQSWVNAIQLAAKSYSGKSIDPYLDIAERSSVQNKAFEYRQAADNPLLNGVGKGLLKLTPAGMAAGAVGSISAVVESLVENGASQTLINVANGIQDFPAELKARLNSADPTVRGEALVDAAALAISGTALTAGASKVALDSVQRAAVTKALAGAEEEAIARAKVVNDFYKEGASSNPPGLYTPSGIIPANAEKTTTVLGRWQSDMQSIIDGQIRAPKSDDFGVAPGGFNVLNVSHATEDAAGVHFFERINKPFLDQALKRGDDIALGTIPQRFDDVLYSNGQLKGNFAKELDYLVKNNYKPVNITSAQWETIKGWFK